MPLFSKTKNTIHIRHSRHSVWIWFILLRPLQHIQRWTWLNDVLTTLLHWNIIKIHRNQLLSKSVINAPKIGKSRPDPDSSTCNGSFTHITNKKPPCSLHSFIHSFEDYHESQKNLWRSRYMSVTKLHSDHICNEIEFPAMHCNVMLRNRYWHTPILCIAFDLIKVEH